MALTDMKQPKPKKEDMEGPCAPGYDRYPWGLRLRMGDKELEKLGIDLKTLSIKTPVAIQAVGTIVELSETQYEKETHRTLEIQITKMALTKQNKGKFDKFSDQQKKGAGE